MKIGLINILILSSLCWTTLQAQSAKAIKKGILDSAKLCTTNAYEIVEGVDAESIEGWADGKLKKDFLRDFGTVVHECLHSYDHEIAFDELDFEDGFFPIGFFLDHDLELVFQGKELYETADLHPKYYPKEVQNLFRYPVYIYGKDVLTKNGKIGPSKASSNKWGIYGLLEEFNAYYHGANAEIEYYRCKQPADDFSDIMTSYYEFNIFMAYYIKYAKQYKKTDYSYLMQQKELRTAYTLMETNWRNLMYTVLKDKKLAALIPSVERTKKVYTPELQKIMSNFMLPQNELSKYKTFFKKRPYDLDFINKNTHLFTNTSVDAFVDAGVNADDFAELLGSSGTGSFSMELEPTFREQGYFYVTVKSTKDMEAAFMFYITKVYTKFKSSAGVLIEDDMTASVFLKKFKSEKEAAAFAKKHKATFSEVKVE
ncbi:MAG: hypothetical protein GY810_24055 [Aureispira sp.]|nr:hypothetical protein [Aureispira sp.]